MSFMWRLLSTAEGCRSGHSTIDMLPDDVLLCIFDSYRRIFDFRGEYLGSAGPGIWPWHMFVHVCRRWRRIFFAFPCYLNLHLICKSKTDVQATLDIWPALPLRIHANLYGQDADDGDEIAGALEHRDHIVGIYLQGFNRSQLKKCIALMQEPFPVLTCLELYADKKMMFVITDAVLGGSAPLLQRIYLDGIRFPGLPKLLSSTHDLVCLSLGGVPMTGEGHISPDAMTTCLSVLTKLRSLTLTFLWQTSSPYSTDQRPLPSTHTVLPSLVHLQLEGPHRCLEDLVGRVNAPLLKYGLLKFYDEPIFDTPQVPQFMHRTNMLKLLGRVEVLFRRQSTFVSFRSSIGPAKLFLSFWCSRFPAQVAIMEQIYAQWPPLVSHVKSLKLGDSFLSEEGWWEVIKPAAWIGFLCPFTAVQTLRLRGIAMVHHIVHHLGRLEGERAAEVLPALCTIELVCSELGARSESESLRLLGPFLVARKESERPVVVNVVHES